MGMCVWFLQSLSTNTAVVGKEGEVGGVVGGEGEVGGVVGKREVGGYY